MIAGSGSEPSPLKPGTVWHTFGYPEPEIFGFLYVHPDRLVSVGIFVPSWMGDPARTAIAICSTSSSIPRCGAI